MSISSLSGEDTPSQRLVERRMRRESCLFEPGEVILLPERSNPCDPGDCFSVSGIVCDEGFGEYILPVLESVEKTPVRAYAHIRLKQRHTPYLNEGIQRALPPTHLTLWEDLVTLTEMYPNGRYGYMLCYMRGIHDEVFTVALRWCSYGKRWNIYAWTQSESVNWSIPCLVLYPLGDRPAWMI
jgi:hypothetical protein